jgi:hypothetical protein
VTTKIQAPAVRLPHTARTAGLCLVIAVGAALLAGGVPTLAADAPAPAPKAAPAEAAPDPSGEPEHVVVQHILIGFQGSVPGKNITRTKEEAEKLANDLLARAKKAGADFGALVKEYTNDAFPGIYGMANNGVRPGSAETPRGRMVKGFGDVAFSLKVDEVGMASYNPQTSPYGWHIIKRIK